MPSRAANLPSVPPFIFVPNCELPPIPPTSPQLSLWVPGGGKLRRAAHATCPPHIFLTLYMLSVLIWSLPITLFCVEGKKAKKHWTPSVFPFPLLSSPPSASASDAGRKESPDPSPSESPPPPQTGSYTILYLVFGQFCVSDFCRICSTKDKKPPTESLFCIQYFEPCIWKVHILTVDSLTLFPWFPPYFNLCQNFYQCVFSILLIFWNFQLQNYVY